MNKIKLCNEEISKKDLSKILFIFNAIEDGWHVKKKESSYIFSKQKCKEKQVFTEDFLNKFIIKYFNLKL
tara:strand:- start:291 stop:500 length:210 start_codon:yes stop_codon:yes gene_type:complete